jgi:hypothetical protein
MLSVFYSMPWLDLGPSAESAISYSFFNFDLVLCGVPKSPEASDDDFGNKPFGTPPLMPNTLEVSFLLPAFGVVIDLFCDVSSAFFPLSCWCTNEVLGLESLAMESFSLAVFSSFNCLSFSVNFAAGALAPARGVCALSAYLGRVVVE